MFIGELKFEPVPGEVGEFELLSTWTWVDEEFGRVDIPPGFITDFASTPQLMRMFKVFDPLSSGSIFGALPHDWLYCLQDRDRSVCDDILRKALIDSGMQPYAARMYWMGVRMGGWVPWRKRLKKGGGPQPEDFANPEVYEKWKNK